MRRLPHVVAASLVIAVAAVAGSVDAGSSSTGPFEPGSDWDVPSRDFARMGLVFLSGGTWGDESIVPAQWVTAANESPSRSPTLDMSAHASSLRSVACSP